MSDRKTIIAVLDDEAGMRSALRRLLGTHGYKVELFETGDDFLTAARSHPPDCLVLDLHMPRSTGFDVLRSLSTLNLKIPAIMVTGHDEPGNAERAHALGAAIYLLKPLDESVLINAIQQVCPPSTGTV